MHHMMMAHPAQPPLPLTKHVYFVNEEHHAALCCLAVVQQGLQPLLKLPAIGAARNHSGNIKSHKALA
jgi:hypothetical protein